MLYPYVIDKNNQLHRVKKIPAGHVFNRSVTCMCGFIIFNAVDFDTLAKISPHPSECEECGECKKRVKEEKVAIAIGASKN